MKELREAIKEANFAQLKLKKAKPNAKRVFEKLKDMKVLPISDMEEAQFILYLQIELGFAGKGKLSSKLSVEARGKLVIIIGEIERNSNQNSKLEFQFCVMCPKLFILKEFYFLILE